LKIKFSSCEQLGIVRTRKGRIYNAFVDLIKVRALKKTGEKREQLKI